MAPPPHGDFRRKRLSSVPPKHSLYRGNISDSCDNSLCQRIVTRFEMTAYGALSSDDKRAGALRIFVVDLTNT